MLDLRKMNLKTKAAVFIAIILVLVMGLSNVILTSAVTSRLEMALLTSSTLIGQGLAGEIIKTVDMGIYLEDLEGLSEQLTATVDQHSDLGYVFISDNQGKLLYQSEGMPEWIAEDLGVPHLDEENPSEPIVTDIQSGRTGFYNISLGIVSGSSAQGTLNVGLRAEVVKAELRRIVGRMLGVGIVSFFIATALIIIFVNRLISRPLANLAQTAREISGGNLVTVPTEERGDEIGELAGAFQVMVGGLTDMIGRFSETSSGLQKSSGELAEVARNLSGSFGEQVGTLDEVVGSIQEMDNLTQNLSKQAQTLSDSANESSSSILESTSAIAEINQHMAEINTAIENITSSILEMSATFSQLAEGADKTAQMAEETKTAVSRINEGVRNMEEMVEQSSTLSQDLKTNAQDIGLKAVKETLRGILSIREDVQSSEQAMNVLNEKVESIGEIITVIEDIADQTNLLALNAAIISAQAGDEGRSFSVIASEIRDLSASTTDSTKKISSLIASVQQETREYTGYVKRVSTSVQDGYELGQQAEEALDKIVQSADESAQMSTQIARVTKEQADASDQVSKSVGVFTERADEIRKATSEEAEAAKFIRESIEKAKHMVERVYRSTEEQNKTSQLLNETVIKAEEIAGKLQMATEKERELSGSIAQAVDTLKSMSHENFEVIKNVDTSSEMLTSLSASLNEELLKFRVSNR